MQSIPELPAAPASTINLLPEVNFLPIPKPQQTRIRSCYFSLLALTLFFMALPTQSQTTFFKWFPTPEHEVANDITQTAHGDYLIVGEKGETSESLHSFIMQLNQYGSIVNEIELPCLSGNSRLKTIDKMPGSDHTFLLTGSRDSVSQNGYYSILTLTVISDSLQIITSKDQISTKGRRYLPWKGKFAGDSNFYLLHQYDSIGGSGAPDIGVSKFDLSFTKISTFHHAAQNPWYAAQDIFFRETDHTIQIFYIGQDMDSKYSLLRILSLSENLDFVASYPGPDQIVTNVSATRLSDSLFFLFGTNTQTLVLPHQHLGCYLLNDSLVVMKTVELYNNPDTLLYAGRGGFNLSLSPETSTAFMTGIYNFDVDNHNWQTTPTWIQLLKTDLNLNLIGNNFFGGDAAYVPYSIKPTTDGGTIITGHRFDYNIPQNQQYDLFIIKTDSSGLIVSLAENQKELMSEAILFPNPGSEYCIALLGAQHPSAMLRLFDLRGAVILSMEIRQQQTKIDLPDLAKGIYPYTFEHDGKVIGSGKWVRK